MSSSRKLTVIVVPETGKRTLTFRFSLLWFVPVVAVVTVLALAVFWQTRTNHLLETRLVELDTLRRTNRLQEAEIETLRNKATQTDQKLTELEALEQQLREIVGQNMPSRSGTSSLEPVHTAGRGGPPAADQTLTNMPSLGSMLPPDVRAYLFTKRDTLPMDLREPQTRKDDRKLTQTTVAELDTQLEKQAGAMERLVADLTDSKRTLLEHIDFVAHVPSGLPVSGGTYTDRFGWRWSPFGWGRQWHDGLDIAHDYWTPAVATADGVVVFSGWKSGGYGYTVMVDHGYGYVTMYAHLSDTKPDVGDEVKRGTLIGWVGSTGNSTGPHLHYEVHANGVPVDPVKYLQ
ncbi:MAG TPA: M23 family metallopeptidase [Symbiobacteriaceae bacterium]|nr:M23 family metallopeptidase [Symbiobacteriaceae bacterium]